MASIPFPFHSHPHSEIYCRGELLHTVQTAKLFNDSKTFVDMKLKESPQQTLDEFKAFMSEHDNNPPKDDIRRFVDVSCLCMEDYYLFNELALIIYHSIQ